MVFLSKTLFEKFSKLERPKSMNRRLKFGLNHQRNNLVVGVLFITLTVAACGTAVVYPMLTIDKWKEVQKENRKGINAEEIQPGGMRVWSDPYKPREN